MNGIDNPVALFEELTMSNVEKYNDTQGHPETELNWIKFKAKIQGIHEACVSLANEKEKRSLDRKLIKVLNTIW